MAFRVNLASEEAHQIAKTNRTVKYLKVSSGILLGVFFLMSMVVFGWFFVKTYQVNKNKELVANLLLNLADRSADEVAYKRYQMVLLEADKVVSGRKDFRGVLLDVYALLPGDALVEGVRFEEEIIVLSVKALGVQSFAAALEGIKRGSEGDGNRFSEVVLSFVERIGDGSYSFQVEISLSEQI